MQRDLAALQSKDVSTSSDEEKEKHKKTVEDVQKQVHDLQEHVGKIASGDDSVTFNEHIRHFANLAVDHMGRLIFDAFKKQNFERNDTYEEVLQHILVIFRKGLGYIGRADFVTTPLQGYILKENNNELIWLFVIHGRSGCGKTTLLSRLALQTSEAISPKGGYVVSRLLGMN